LFNLLLQLLKLKLKNVITAIKTFVTLNFYAFFKIHFHLIEEKSEIFTVVEKFAIETPLTHRDM